MRETCPFCGAQASPYTAGVGSGLFWAFCSDRTGCGAMGPLKPTAVEAMDAFCVSVHYRGIRDGVELAKEHAVPYRYSCPPDADCAWDCQPWIDWTDVDREIAKLAEKDEVK